MICENCQKEFFTKHKKQRFCSGKCAQAGRAVLVNCSQCNIQFKPKWRNNNQHNFCTDECRSAFHNVRYGIFEKDGQKFRRCSICENTLNIEEFWKDSASASGFCCSCKSCTYSKRDRTSDNYKQYLADTAKKTIVRFRKGVYSAVKRGYIWSITLEQYEELIVLPCHYCGQALDECGTGLDRKDNGLIYSIDLVAPCCGRCNTTFMANFNYEEKLQLAATIRIIDAARESGIQLLQS